MDERKMCPTCEQGIISMEPPHVHVRRESSKKIYSEDKKKNDITSILVLPGFAILFDQNCLAEN